MIYWEPARLFVRPATEEHRGLFPFPFPSDPLVGGPFNSRATEGLNIPARSSACLREADWVTL